MGVSVGSGVALGRLAVVGVRCGGTKNGAMVGTLAVTSAVWVPPSCFSCNEEVEVEDGRQLIKDKIHKHIKRMNGVLQRGLLEIVFDLPAGIFYL